MNVWLVVIIGFTWAASLLAAFLAGFAYATINVAAAEELEQAR